MKHCTHSLRLLLLPAVLLGLLSPLPAQSDRELRDQRTAAQRERQEETRVRTQGITDATRALREYAGALDQEYRARLRELDVAFELRQVQLKAEQDRRVASAEAEFQRQWSALFRPIADQDMPDRLNTMQQQARAHSDQLYQIRKGAAGILHREQMALVERQHALLEEMDEKVLSQAASLGLTEAYDPILATPIGGELTRAEEQWNQRAVREAERLNDRNAATLSRYVHGEKLRAWERSNLEEDFQLLWAERDELRELESQASFFSAWMQQAGQGEEADPQALMERLSELNQQQQLIKIKYDQTRRENSINRREERRRLTSD